MAGSIDTDNQQVYIRLDGALDTVDKIRNTPVVEGGRTMKLSDIADARRGYEDPATFLVHHNGEPSLMLDVVMQDQFNGLDLGKALEAEQSKLQKALPVGLPQTVSTDNRNPDPRIHPHASSGGT